MADRIFMVGLFFLCIAFGLWFVIDLSGSFNVTVFPYVQYSHYATGIIGIIFIISSFVRAFRRRR